MFYSASVTAVFELGDGTVKRFTRIVQGSSSEHRINGEVINFNLTFFLFVSFLQFIMFCSFGMYYDCVMFAIVCLVPLVVWGKVAGTPV